MEHKSKRILYFGLDPSRYRGKGDLVHLPLIRTEPFPFEEMQHFFALPHTHVLFTSRVAVEYFFRYTDKRDKKYITIGHATADKLLDFGVTCDWMATEPSGEGVAALLKRLDGGPILYPHSASSRPLLPALLKGTAFPLYRTFQAEVTLPNLDIFDTFVFTSPSTVESFRKLCLRLPPREKCEAIGPITENALNKLFD